MSRTIAVAASTGTAPTPRLLLRALAGGAVPVASRLPQYEEVLEEGELGLSAGRLPTLADGSTGTATWLGPAR